MVIPGCAAATVRSVTSGAVARASGAGLVSHALSLESDGLSGSCVTPMRVWAVARQLALRIVYTVKNDSAPRVTVDDATSERS